MLALFWKEAYRWQQRRACGSGNVLRQIARFANMRRGAVRKRVAHLSERVCDIAAKYIFRRELML